MNKWQLIVLLLISFSIMSCRGNRPEVAVPSQQDEMKDFSKMMSVLPRDPSEWTLEQHIYSYKDKYRDKLSPPNGTFKPPASLDYFSQLVVGEYQKILTQFDDAFNKQLVTDKDDYNYKVAIACFEVNCPYRDQLISNVSDLNRLRDNGQGLLFFAIFYQNVDMVKFLLEKGVNPSPQNTDYNPLLFSLFYKDWKSYVLLEKFMSTSVPSKKELGKCGWSKKVIPKEVSYELHNISKTTPMYYSSKCTFDQLRFLKSTADGREHDRIMNNAKFLQYHRSYFPSHKGNRSVALIDFGFIENGREVDDSYLGRNFSFYEKPSWGSKILKSITYNPYDLMFTKIGSRGYPSSYRQVFLRKYFSDDLDIIDSEFSTFFDPSSFYYYIIVSETKNDWLKIELVDTSKAWIHISKVPFIEPAPRLLFSSRIKFIQPKDNVSVFDCMKPLKLRYDGGEVLNGKYNTISVLSDEEFSDHAILRINRDYKVDNSAVTIFSNKLCHAKGFTLSYTFLDTHYRKGYYKLHVEKVVTPDY